MRGASEGEVEFNWRNNRKITLSGCMLLLILTAIVGPALPSVQIAGGTLFPFRALVVVLIPVVAALVLRSEQLRLSGSFLLYTAFFVHLVFAVVPLNRIVLSVRAVVLILLPATLCVFVALAVDSRQSAWMYVSVIELLLISSLVVALWEVLTGNHLSTSRVPELAWYLQHRMTAWYHNTNDFAYFLAVLFPMAITQLLYGNWVKRLVSGTVVAGTAGVFFQLVPRAAIAAVVLSTVICVGLYATRSWMQSYRLGFVRAVQITPFAVTTGAVSVALRTTKLPVDVGQSTTVRWNLFKIASEIAMTTVTGDGLFGLQRAAAQSSIFTNGITSPHFWLTWLLGTVGLTGTALFLGSYSLALGSSLQRYLQNESPLDLAVFGTLVSFSIAAIGPSNAFMMEITWVVFGLCLAASRLAPSSMAPKETVRAFTKSVDTSD